MKLNYFMDLDKNSIWKINTPGDLAKQLPFYVNECGHYIAYDRYYTEREGLNNYLLMYTLSGSGYIRFRDHELLLGPNQCVIIDCSHYHYYKTYSEVPWEFKWVHFNGIGAKEYIRLLNESSIHVTALSQPIPFERNLDALQQLIDMNDIASNLQLSSKMTDIMSTLILEKLTPANNRKSEEQRSVMKKTLSFIHKNYHQKITLDDLIQIAYMSKYHFLRVFKKHMGTSPYKYITNFRINKSKELLKESNLSVADIASRVGFGDANNYIREFKKIVGITPLNYRKYHNI